MRADRALRRSVLGLSETYNVLNSDHSQIPLGISRSDKVVLGNVSLVRSGPLVYQRWRTGVQMDAKLATKGTGATWLVSGRYEYQDFWPSDRQVRVITAYVALGF